LGDPFRVDVPANRPPGVLPDKISQKNFEKGGQAVSLVVIFLISRVLSYEGLPFEPSYSRHFIFILGNKVVKKADKNKLTC